MIKPEYIDFIVAPYALDDALKALINNGVTGIGVTKEDDYLCVRYQNIDYEARRKPIDNPCGVEE